MLIDGAIIMVIGTGTVFTFLGIMVCMITLMTYLVNRFPSTNPQTVAANTGRLACDNFKAEKIAIAIAVAKAFAEGE